jgi:hypothetical protein
MIPCADQLDYVFADGFIVGVCLSLLCYIGATLYSWRRKSRGAPSSAKEG